MADFFPGNPPNAASYQPPRADFSWLGDLGNEYFRGTQHRLALEQQNLFRGCIPTDPSGQPDYARIADMTARTGGLEYALPLLKLMQRQQLAQGDLGVFAQPGTETGA